jgi:hypothetical protein
LWDSIEKEEKEKNDGQPNAYPGYHVKRCKWKIYKRRMHAAKEKEGDKRLRRKYHGVVISM